MPDNSAPWGLHGGGSGVSLPRAATASASQTPPGAAPPSAPESPTPSPGPTPSLTALHSPGHRPHCSWLSRDLSCHLRTSVPRVLGALYPPISAITDSGRDRVQFGVPPAVHPEHILFLFLFICWSSLRCLFKTSTVAFKKTVKSLCLTLRIKSSFSTLKSNWRED